MTGGHLGDALSALLDGELDPGATSGAREHLAGCAGCRAELAATARVRDAVRALPAADPPSGFLERLGRARSRPGRAYAALAGAAAAAAVAVVMANPSSDAVDPRLDDLVERHAATASAGGDPVTQFVPAGVRIGP